MLDKVQAPTNTCYHCGLPLIAGSIFSGEVGGDERNFCCPACRAVAETIHASGLGNFYRYNQPSGEATEANLVEESFSRLDDPEIYRQYAVEEGGPRAGFARITLLIGGIHCAACVWLLEKYLAALPGVESVVVSLADQTASIYWDARELPLSRLFRAIAGLGYEPQFYQPDALSEFHARESRKLLLRLGVAGLAMMQVGMFAIALYAGALQGIEDLYRDYLRWISALMATPVVLYSAQPFFIGAWRGIRHRSPGMDLPVAIAIAIAYIASLRATVTGQGEVYFDSVAMFSFLLLTGRFLEQRARRRGATIQSDLNSLLPALVTRLAGERGESETIPLRNVAVGDHILVKAGQVLPVDGVVVAGAGDLSESQLTGEFIPRARAVGEEVLAGSMLESGTLTIEAQSVGAGLKLQTINALLAKARLSKPRVAQLADRLASVFVMGVLGLALLTYGYWRFTSTVPEQAFWIMLSVLVVSCPCALSLATPAALTAAAHRLRQWGLLVTNGDVWERVAGITDVICDKTGTLTQGTLTIDEVLPLSAPGAEQYLTIAAALEQFSDHPVARAFHRSGTTVRRATCVVVDEGRGVQAEFDGVTYRIGKPSYVAELGFGIPEVPKPGSLWVLLGSREGPLCWFSLKDCLRDDADQCVTALKALGFKLHLLSGDSSGGAERLAGELHFDYCRAGVSPEEKLQYVQALQQQGSCVMMIGDGINDIPVLATADISVAMANASNLAKTQADAIALSGQLMSVVRLLRLSRSTRRVIYQNLGWALSYNVLAIPLAAAGWVPPWAAALGMSMSSLVVVVNALRLHGNSVPLSAEAPPGKVFG